MLYYVQQTCLLLTFALVYLGQGLDIFWPMHTWPMAWRITWAVVTIVLCAIGMSLVFYRRATHT